jgi:iron complex transport system permease protein
LKKRTPDIVNRFIMVSFLLTLLLLISIFLALSTGSLGIDITAAIASLKGEHDKSDMLPAIIWRIRFPRALLAALVGGTLSLGGLVFQALLRNPLAEPYILGISGGSAIGAIIGILAGLTRFPGVSLTAFTGSLITLFLLLMLASGKTILKKDSLLLSGVMVNAFCSAVIMFLVSMTQDTRLHNIIFWLMGDLSLADMNQVAIVASIVIPCFFVLFGLSHVLNLLLTGKEIAKSLGINVKRASIILLVVTSLMVSVTVSHCGLLGFVGLVIPHLLRLILGPDHRILVPACILGGGTYMVLCDILARWLPEQGEIPAGVITAMIGAPLFIYLLKRTHR